MKSIAVSVLKDPKLIEELCWTAFKNGFKIGGFVGPANIKALTEDELKKLKKELKPGAVVISNYFTFPKWKPDKVKDDVYLYINT